MNKVLYSIEKSADAKYRIPNSALGIAAWQLEGKFEWAIVDGNLETDFIPKTIRIFPPGSYKYIGFTVIPGPQAKQAIPFAKNKEQFPRTVLMMGRLFFPSNHYKVILTSGYVDFVINASGMAFPWLER